MCEILSVKFGETLYYSSCVKSVARKRLVENVTD
jgi:hypothetical protein